MPNKHWRPIHDDQRAGLEAIGHELKEDPPAILAKTRAKKGKAAAERQRVAILMSKAGMSRKKKHGGH